VDGCRSSKLNNLTSNEDELADTLKRKSIEKIEKLMEYFDLKKYALICPPTKAPMRLKN
jgi:hypothetical protein